MIEILQQILIGAIQGITEWLPISSKTVLLFIYINFFQETNIELLLKNILFLHLGTFFAALIYFRKDVLHLIKNLFNYPHATPNTKKVLNFLIISTLISGILGLLFLQLIENLDLNLTAKLITISIGVLLLFTAIIQLKIKKRGQKKFEGLKITDGVILGFAQGLAAIPGISRSGITISSLLLREFDDNIALRLSFLMSLPIVLAGNIILNLDKFSLTNLSIYALLSSFILGLLTIHALIKLSRKINFGWFVLIFALLMILSSIIL